MRIAAIFLPIAAVLSAGSAAWSSDEVVMQVARPILSEGAGVSVVDVPQLVWGDEWASPGCRVLWTTADAYFKTSIGLENRNAAARMWIKIRPVGLFGDTLRMVLDISAMPRESPRPLGGPADAALEATLNCMIINAGRDAHKPQHLDVQVEGRSGFERLAGPYRVQPVPAADKWNGREPLWKLRKESSN